MTSARAVPSKLPSPAHPKYRPDIDGLRAVAVLCVVAFHAFPDMLKGGFIGVDIFFVISGYLISTIIFENLARHTFSFADFYVRRVRRIFPALMLVLTSSLIFGWFFLYPDEYKQLGKHIAAGAGFISNFVFWQESGYFDNVAETKPLLHLWSLGIEEQFYLVWPLMLWLAWKLKLNLLATTLFVAAISFALNINQVHSDAAASFYSPQTRFWELLAGAVLAHVTLERQNRVTPASEAPASLDNARKLGNFLAYAGAVLMALGLLLISKERAFPGWWAVLPTAAAVLVIAAGPQAWLNRVLLSNRVMIWLGLISFPLYLWHWPLLSFVRIITDEKPAPQIVIAAVLTAIALAGCTYQWLEKPIRQGKRTAFSPRVLVGLMAAVGLAGYLCYQQDKLPLKPASRFQAVNEGDIGHGQFHAYKNQLVNLCAQYVQSPIACFQSSRSDLKKIAVVGDSHADHLTVGLAGQLPTRNIVFFDTLGLPLFNSKEGANLLQFVMADKQITNVILSASWYARLGSVSGASSLESELTRVVTQLAAAGKRVFIVDDVPNFSFPPEKCRYPGRWLRAHQCSEKRDHFYRQHSQYFPAFESLQRKTDVQIIKIADYFCNQDVCTMAKDHLLLYRDNNHLNLNGSTYVAQQMLQSKPQLAADE